MLRKLKTWLMERYFPAEAKVEIAALQQEVAEMKAENGRLNAYINGLEVGVRIQRRITINNGVNTK